MSKWYWLGGAVLFAIAAASTWFAFHSPAFFVGLGGIALTALVNAIMSAKGSPESRQRVREGLEPHERESK